MTSTPAPAAPPAAARRRWVRVALRVALALLLVVVASGVGAYLWLSNRVTHAPAVLDGPRPEALPALDYLLIGSDTREGASAEFQEEGIDAVAGARSDTTVLLHLPQDSDKALLVSFPRDLWVDLPSCRRPDGTTSEPRRGRFNLAYTTGGAACTMKAVESLTGVRLDDYVQVDFASFRTVVDALGGVPFCTPVPLEDPAVPRRGSTPGHGTGLSLPAGTTTLDGDEALALVRARYGIGDGSDLGRIQRQQQFLGAVVRRATSTQLLLNPPRLLRFLHAATGALTTGDLGLRDLRGVADRVRGLEPGKVTFVTVPVREREDRATLALVEPAAGRLFAALRDDAPVPGGAPDAVPAVPVEPSAVRVRVLNGTGQDGLARRVADELRAIGFQVVDVADADSADYAETVVRHGPTRVESSQTLAAAVPGSTRQEDASLERTLELVVGRDFTRTTEVRVPSAPQPDPSATRASPSAPTGTTAADDPCA